jgi:hypothetical protein
MEINETEQVKKVRLVLLALLVGYLAVAVALVCLYETDQLPSGEQAGVNPQLEFVVTTAMELLTIGAIPLALKFFKFKSVRRSFHQNGVAALRQMGQLRISLLALPMVANTLLYYMYMNTTFGYMAIILLLCLPFVFPTLARCQAELEDSRDELDCSKPGEQEDGRP